MSLAALCLAALCLATLNLATLNLATLCLATLNLAGRGGIQGIHGTMSVRGSAPGRPATNPQETRLLPGYSELLKRSG